jgi:DNA-binding transcriptional LysR family regulator
VELDWLVEQKLILPSYTHGLRALIEKALARKGLSLHVVIEADSYRVQTSLVEEGLGYSVLPPSAIRDEVLAGRLETAPIAKPGVTRELVLASPIDRPPSIAMAKVSSFIIEEFRNLVSEGLWSIRMEV